jgi:ribosomal protein S27E
MSAFYKQNEDYFLRLVCPECSDEVLISEYGETVFCETCGEEYPISKAPTRQTLGDKPK